MVWNYSKLVGVRFALILLFVALIPFQDTLLQKSSLGYFGASLSVLPLAGLIILNFAEYIYKEGLKLAQQLAFFWWILLYSFLVGGWYLVSWGLESHGENLAFKGLKIAILTFFFVYPIFFISYEKVSINFAIYLAFIFTILGVILNDIEMMSWLGQGTFLHYSGNLNMRPRGFALESSNLSVQVVTLGLLTIHFMRSTIAKIIIFALVAALVLYAESKGGRIAFVAAAFVVTIGMRVSLAKKSLGILIVTLYAYMALSGIETLLIGAVSNPPKIVSTYDATSVDTTSTATRVDTTSTATRVDTTSTATRITMALASIITVVNNPFGVGFSGYLPAISRYGPQAAKYVDEYTGQKQNFSEVNEYFGNSSKNVSAKAFVFNYLIIFGWPFLFFFVFFLVKLIRSTHKLGSSALTAAVIFSVIAISTYSDGIGLYNIALVLGIAFDGTFRNTLTISD